MLNNVAMPTIHDYVIMTSCLVSGFDQNAMATLTGVRMLTVSVESDLSSTIKHTSGRLLSGIPDRPGQRRRIIEYEERLSTFQDPPNPWPRASPSPQYLARIGFTYTGYEQIVKCFICQVEISEWDDGKDPLVTHYRGSPDCTFILQRFPSELKQLLQEERVVHCSPQFSNSSYRLHTFSSWQHSGHVTSYQLASAGFFYSGHGTRVECFSCGLVYEDWKRGDLPLHIHRQLRPHCQFITSLLSKDSHKSPTLEPSPPTPADYPASRVPDYTNKTVRVQSFKHLARNFPVSAIACAEAGLFFVRKPDVMKCFSCGVIVKNWVDGDIPIEKHREANSRCTFLCEAFPTKLTDHSKEDHMMGTGFPHELGVDPNTLPEPEFDEDDLEQMSLQHEAKCKIDSGELVTEKVKALSLNSPVPIHPAQTLTPSAVEDSTDNVCVVCMDASLEVVLIPCGHMCVCESCSRQIVTCPMCRMTVNDAVKVFFP